MRTRDFERLLYGGYQIVYADPPWHYANSTCRGGAEKHYETMRLEDLLELEVKRIVADDALLFCWATWPLVEQAFPVMRAWGFEYKTNGFLWVKTNDDGTLFRGTGYYTRANTEFCLIGVRGNWLERLDLGVDATLLAPRRQHSAKPDEVRYRIERLYGNVKRVELFARESAQGWDAWGDEIGDDDGTDVLLPG